MLKYDCFVAFRHVKYYFGYEIPIIFYSDSPNQHFSFLTPIEINLMFFEAAAETKLLISQRILVPYTFLVRSLYATNFEKLEILGKYSLVFEIISLKNRCVLKNLFLSMNSSSL